MQKLDLHQAQCLADFDSNSRLPCVRGAMRKSSEDNNPGAEETPNFLGCCPSSGHKAGLKEMTTGTLHIVGSNC